MKGPIAPGTLSKTYTAQCANCYRTQTSTAARKNNAARSLRQLSAWHLTKKLGWLCDPCYRSLKALGWPER